MSKKPHFIKVHAHSFYMILDALQKQNNGLTSMKIKNVSLSNFLLRASNYETAKAFIPKQVKEAILLTYGIANPDPTKLKDDKDMSDFEFNNMQNIALTKKFNKIALSHNPDAKTIIVNSVVGCNKVMECITLVANASSFSISQIPQL